MDRLLNGMLGVNRVLDTGEDRPRNPWLAGESGKWKRSPNRVPDSAIRSAGFAESVFAAKKKTASGWLDPWHFGTRNRIWSAAGFHDQHVRRLVVLVTGVSDSKMRVGRGFDSARN